MVKLFKMTCLKQFAELAKCCVRLSERFWQTVPQPRSSSNKGSVTKSVEPIIASLNMCSLARMWILKANSIPEHFCGIRGKRHQGQDNAITCRVIRTEWQVLPSDTLERWRLPIYLLHEGQWLGWPTCTPGLSIKWGQVLNPLDKKQEIGKPIAGKTLKQHENGPRKSYVTTNLHETMVELSESTIHLVVWQLREWKCHINHPII